MTFVIIVSWIIIALALLGVVGLFVVLLRKWLGKP